MNDLKPQFLHVIPAHAGYFVVHPIIEAGGVKGCSYHSILGWALAAETLTPFPITAEGVMVELAFIVRPDNSIEHSSGLMEFVTVEEWLAWLRKQPSNQVTGSEM